MLVQLAYTFAKLKPTYKDTHCVSTALTTDIVSVISFLQQRYKNYKFKERNVGRS